MWNNLVSAYSNFIRPVQQGLSNFGNTVGHAVQNEVQQAPRQISQGVNYVEHLAPQLPQINIPRFQPLNIGNIGTGAENFAKQTALGISGGILNPAINSINNTLQSTNQALNQNRGNPFGAALQATGGLAKNTLLNPSLLADEASLSIPFGRGKNLLTKSIIPGALSSGIYNAGQPGANPLSVGKSMAIGAGTSLLNLPTALSGAKTISKALKGYSPNAFNIHPQDQQVMSDFINAVQSGAAKSDLGQLGKDAQVLAEHYIGSSARTASNQKLAQAFDALLSSAARARGEDALQTQFPSMGIVSKGQPTLGATQGKGLVSQSSQGQMPPQIKGKVQSSSDLSLIHPSNSEGKNFQSVGKILQDQKEQLPLQQNQLPSDQLQNNSSTKKVSQLPVKKQEVKPMTPIGDILAGNKNKQNIQEPATQPIIGNTAATSKNGLRGTQKGKVASSLPQSLNPELSSSSNGSIAQGKERKFVTSVKGSDEVSPNVQGQVQGSYNPKSNQTLLNNSQGLLKKGLNTATTKVLGDLAQKTGTLSDQAVSDAIAVAKAHDTKGNFDQATQIYDKLAEHLTEAGRQVQAASLLENRTPQGMLYSAIKTLKKSGVGITDQITSHLKGFVNDVKATAAGTPERNIATQKLVNYVNDNIPRSKWDAITGIWRAGLLTGPETVAKVAVSHAVTTPFELASQIPAELHDRMFSLFTGKRGVTATLRGGASGLATGTKGLLTKITSGIDNPNTGGFGSDFGTHTSQTPYEKFVYNVHGALPKPAFNARYNISLNDQALTEAANQGLKGAEKEAFVKKFVANPTQTAIQNATHDAEVATNQQKTLATKTAGDIQRFPVIGKIIAPFTRIPSAIGANGLWNYTPFGYGSEVAKQIRSGTLNQRALSQAFGRSATGTSIAALGALLGYHGLMTLQAPQDPKERALWDLQGKQPNSIKIGNNWVSLNSLGPVGIVMGLGGGFGFGLKQNNNDPLAAAGTAAAAGGRLLLDQPYLKGISGLGQALNDPTRYGTSLFNNTAGSVVPALSQQIARGTDTVQRIVPKDLGGKFASEIPVAREKVVPTQHDLFGNTLPGSNPSGSIPGAISGTLNPFYPSAGRTDAITPELQRLYDSLGSSSSPAIGAPSANQTIQGQKVTLNQGQLQQLIQQQGPHVQQAISSVINDPAYHQLSDEEKANAINTSITEAKKQVSSGVNLNGNLQPAKNATSSQPVQSAGVNKLNNKLSYIDPKTNSIKKIDLNPPSAGTGIDAFTNQDWKYTKAREVFKSPIPDATKQQAYQQLGVDPSRVEYDYKAAHSDPIKTQYVAAKASTESHQALIQDLVNGRVQSQSGKLFASNGVLDGLAQQGVISLDEAKALKAVEYTSSGQNIGTSSKVRSGRGGIRVARIPKIPSFSAKAPKAPKLTKVKALSLPKVRLTGSKLASSTLKVKPIRITRVSKSAKLT